MDAQDAAFDKIMENVGNNGRFQKTFNVVFNVGLVICASMAYMNIILALNVPEHWCHVPGRENTNFTLAEWKTLTLPNELDNRGQSSFSKCKMYNISKELSIFNKTDQVWNVTHLHATKCQYGHDYDKTYYEVTATSQENWICDRELYVTNTFVLNRIGEVVGTFIVGQLGDTLGRRFVYYISLTTVLLGRIASMSSASYFIIFSIAAVIGSFTSNSVFQAPLVIAMEISKGEDRAHIAMLQCIGWTVGMCIMPIVFWLTRDWIWFVALTTFPGILFFCFPTYMIESPRWLANKGRLTQCAHQLNKIAAINGRKIVYNEKMLQDSLPEHKVEHVYGMMSLFSGWRLAKNTFLIVICWIVCSMSYFVLVLNASRMDGNPFTNFLWQSAVELPAYIIGKWSSDKIGRRFTSSLSFAMAAVAGLIQIFLVLNPENEIYSVTIAIIIKFFISITFFIVNLQAMETYPTCLRQTGISIGCITANALGVLGPYIVYLGTNYDVRYPYVIMALIASLASGCSLFLPETLHQKLPETLNDAQNFGADQSFWYIPKPPKCLTDDVVVPEEEEKLHKVQ